MADIPTSNEMDRAFDEWWLTLSSSARELLDRQSCRVAFFGGASYGGKLVGDLLKELTA